jgi:hypothetical protein
MRILAVNVRAGGTAGTTSALLARCLGHDPHAVVLSEFRPNRNGILKAGSFEHRGNGVLIASKRPFKPLCNPFGLGETDIEINLGQRRLRDEFSTADLYEELERHATEAWLHMHPGRSEFSWYPFRKSPAEPQRNGWRIDKAFVEFRLAGLTDH